MSDLRDEALVAGLVRSFFISAGDLDFGSCKGDVSLSISVSGEVEASLCAVVAKCRFCGISWRVRPQRLSARVHAEVAGGEEGEA